MLLLLQNINNENVFYLTEKEKFLVGRKDCEFLIQDDQSISRKHAIIRLKENKVTVEDCGSKYKTLYKGENLEPNTEIELDVGDIIQFGVSHSSYRLQKYEFVITGTCLNSNVKTKLISDLSIINGKYVDQWTSDCTHLTLEEITLTVKFLHALIDEKPIVKPMYWSKFAERVQKKLSPPNINLYNKPPVAEVLLSKVDLSPNPKRKELFKGKLFVFLKEKDKKQLEDVIKKAGGSSISWEKNPISLEDIEKSFKELLIIETANMANDSSLNKVIKQFSKQGKRTIPLQEIAVSITLCSCETNCNPSFNRVEQVFPSSGPIEPTQNNALAANTESEQYTMREFKVEEKAEPVTVPDTFEPKLNESEVCKIFTESEMTTEKDVNNSQSVKRINDDKPEETPLKKIKIDDSSVDVEKDKTKKNVEEGKFMSKNTKKVKEDKQIDNSGSRTNQFTFLSKNKTYKMEQNSVSSNNPFKRTKMETNSPPNNPFKRMKKDSDKTTQISKDNPFLLSLGSRKRTNDDSSEPSTSKKKRGGTIGDKIFSSTRIENTSHNISGLSRISKITKDFINNTWMSKNTTNVIDTEKVKVDDHLDMEMKQFIEQFKNTVIVEIMAQIPLKQKILRDRDNDASNGKVNFKIFKKVKPLKPQRIIIGKDNFTAFGPGDTTKIADSRREIISNSDDEAEKHLKIKNRKPKKFII